ncbi:hypothetical protein F503_03102 [Ophiostoma piceae UAMH 11346]|uniref:Microcystin LR degradation protein MlrC C-terminal domain-containing protein n=1 Tax=Ophiostoma piceae (strain UAMH 11346) TaxID=1262450 RepID=S3D0C3_OPHP1|nr:hypothetical protein F503_03102 [Ophiostoma piceae UAMH 11346]
MGHDPHAALAAHKAGVCALVTLDLGGRHGPEGRTIGRRSIRLGPTAVLTIGGVEVIVGSERMRPYDMMAFQHLGVEPEYGAGVRCISVPTMRRWRRPSSRSKPRFEPG